MRVLVDRGAGGDVHKESITVCLLISSGRRDEQKIIRKFSTFHEGLLEMRDWLMENRITHFAMESTGEYWKPVYAILEEHLTVIVANAQHVKNVPGRKTDPEDAAWMARLLRHGLLTPSFVPARAIRDLRDKTRSRRKLVQTITRVENRCEKILESSGVKLGSVASEVFGVSGRLMLEELAQNHTDPVEVSQLARRSLKKKIPQLQKALRGGFREHHATLLRRQLDLHDFLLVQLRQLDAEIKRDIAPYAELIERLDAMPGLNPTSIYEIIGEIGIDMSAWEKPEKFAAWSGLCPGNNESAGKKRHAPARKGNPFLKSLLIQCATGASRTKGSFYQAKFKSVCSRRGYKRALVAVAHSMLLGIYQIIKTGAPYRELGSVFHSEQEKQRKVHSYVKQMEKMGLTVTVHERLS